MSPLQVALAFIFIAACGESNGSPGTGTGDPQTPPTTSGDAIETWLRVGSYQSWRCESEAHDPRSPSPHVPRVRVCSNELLANAGSGPYPVGSANVTEISDGDLLKGHAVYVKDKAGNGEAYVWYERIADEVYAFGHGDGGRSQSSCVGCHAGAGSTGPGHDFVFTQVGGSAVPVK